MTDKTLKQRQYDEHRKRTKARQDKLVKAGQEIGPIPAVKRPHIRQAASKDFEYFCREYFPETFYLDWSNDHRRVIAKLEQACTEGGLFAFAMPRGSGKTALARTAALWSILTGRRRYVVIVAANQEAAASHLTAIQSICETSEELISDWPEILYPVKKLERITHRQRGQLCSGVSTRINWTGDKLIFPTVRGSKASGSIVTAAGLESGNIRGQSHATANGKIIRPDLCIIDDPQTRESAASVTQTKRRLDILKGDVLGLAGPGKTIAGFIACTVISPDDLAARILDRTKHPEWQGERTKLMYSMPTNHNLWEQYRQIRDDNRQTGDIGRAATAFYREHRDEMDEGAVVAWPARYRPEEASAIQHAMNLKFDQGDEAFAAEYQNDPLPLEDDMIGQLNAGDVAKKTTGRPRGESPLQAIKITGFVDVHDNMLFWAIVAWEQNFTGYVIDYGTHPEQKEKIFSQQSPKRTLKHHYTGAGVDGAIHAGLDELVALLLNRKFPRGQGQAGIDRLLIDSGYKPDIVAGIRAKHGNLIMPSKGVGVTAGKKPFAAYHKKPGEQHGLNWYIPNVTGTREFQHVLYDSNFWKTRIHQMLATAPGDPGCLTFFGTDPRTHELFIDHLVNSEFCVETEGYGRKVKEWKHRPHRPDNHWLDCVVGSAVAASMVGVVTPGVGPQQIARRKRKFRPLNI